MPRARLRCRHLCLCRPCPRSLWCLCWKRVLGWGLGSDPARRLALRAQPLAEQSETCRRHFSSFADLMAENPFPLEAQVAPEACWFRQPCLQLFLSPFSIRASDLPLLMQAETLAREHRAAMQGCLRGTSPSAFGEWPAGHLPVSQPCTFLLEGWRAELSSECVAAVGAQPWRGVLVVAGAALASLPALQAPGVALCSEAVLGQSVRGPLRQGLCPAHHSSGPRQHTGGVGDLAPVCVIHASSC